MRDCALENSPIEPDALLSEWSSVIRESSSSVCENFAENKAKADDRLVARVRKLQEKAKSIRLTYISPVAYKTKIDEAVKRSENAYLNILKNFYSLKESKTVNFFSTSTLNKLDHVKSRFPNASAFIDQVKQEIALGNLSTTGGYKFSPILLDGKPGVGKSAVIKAVSKVVGLSVGMLNLGSMQDAFQLSGLTTGFSSGKPGALADIYVKSPNINNLVILDELDKVSTSNNHVSVYAPLHILLEPLTACTFRDECLELDLDTSFTSWFATANNLDAIPDSIVSRFNVITIEPPDRNQIPAIANSIYKDLLIEVNCQNAFAPDLNDELLQTLLEVKSSRDLKKMLRFAMGNAAIEVDELHSPIVLQKKHLEQAPRYQTKKPIGFVY